MPGLPFTQKMLLDWAGQTAFRDAQNLVDRGAVLHADFEPPLIKGEVAWGNRTILTSARVLKDGACENLCPCRDNRERGIVCSHIIAVALTLVRRATDPERERKYREEMRRAERAERLNEGVFLRRAAPGEKHATAARLLLTLAADWPTGWRAHRMPIRIAMEIEGRAHPIASLPTDRPLLLDPHDDDVLLVLEDIAQDRLPDRMDLKPSDAVNILELYQGRTLTAENDPTPLTVNAATMQSRLRMELDGETGELLLILHTELPFAKPGEFPIYLVAGRRGWAYLGGHFWPLERVLPEPLQAVYDQPIVIPRPAIPRFFEAEVPQLARHMPVETDLSLDVLTMDPATPRFLFTARGSPASLAFTLQADYNGIVLTAGKPDPIGYFAHPDPNDFYRFTVRNPAAEQAALQRLGRFGITGETGDDLSTIVGTREVLNILGSVLPAIRRLGWQVKLEGRVSPFMDEMTFATPVVRVTRPEGDRDWFEVDFEYDDGEGGSLSAVDIQRALRKNEHFIEHNGRTLLLDADAIRGMTEVFRDCAGGEGRRPGSFRLAGIYSSYVQSSLDALDGIDVEADPTWRALAERRHRRAGEEVVALPADLDALLRPYQKEGVQWLRFLENHLFGGILADEMGLGKTVQTLAWIQMQRALEGARHQPALIVCPTSLVMNWAEEAARFTPQLKVLPIAGADRATQWAEVSQADLVITSYALLRRDIELFVNQPFAIAVLDEAQHIKNRSTQNAIAAKRIQAAHRLVLTGTPIENSVMDLWSIMDFLMPDYLGRHDTFRSDYEQVIAQGGPEAEAAYARLRRKLRPFMLRRLKRDVARDLPPKIERIATCELTVDQKRVYAEILKDAQRTIDDLVSRQGFESSRMQILQILMRLRQICCHLDLLQLDGLRAEEPSAKMDLFFELLDEAMDAGHRVLVFSQFVRMLTILRGELERRNLRYAYLDGSTKERMQVVHAFNTDRAIPVFLISLKAGGTGLNLTGADMVVHYDPWWNPAVENQATDRAYRIGQKRTVYSVKLIASDTIEERVLAMQRRKKQIIDATLSSDEQVLNKLTLDDIRDLLAMD